MTVGLRPDGGAFVASPPRGVVSIGAWRRWLVENTDATRPANPQLSAQSSTDLSLCNVASYRAAKSATTRARSGWRRRRPSASGSGRRESTRRTPSRERLAGPPSGGGRLLEFGPGGRRMNGGTVPAPASGAINEPGRESPKPHSLATEKSDPTPPVRSHL